MRKLSATKTIQAKLSARQIPEEAYYEMAGEEVARGTIRKGLWVKAMSEALGDEKKAGALYIRLRVQAMRTEAAVAIRQAADRDLFRAMSVPIAEKSEDEKIILGCPECSGRLRVSASTHLDITCPHCRAVFRRQT